MITGICNSTKEEDIQEIESQNNLRIKRMYMMEEYLIDAFKHIGEKRDLLKSLELYHKGLISYEQVILTGKFSMLKQTSEKDMRKMMGILAE
jgi:hypothetical protein